MKREAGQLLEWKQKVLVGLENAGAGKKGGGGAGDLEGLRRDLEEVREQVEGLEGHLRRREAELEGVRREVAEVR